MLAGSASVTADSSGNATFAFARQSVHAAFPDIDCPARDACAHRLVTASVTVRDSNLRKLRPL